MSRGRLAVLVLACAAAVSTAACTSGGGNSPATSASTPTQMPTDSASSDTSLPTDSASASVTSRPPTTASRTAAPDTGCTMAQLRIAAARGSGFQGREFAQLLFTNKSATICTVFGFPGVSLRRNGTLLGQPAVRESVTPKIVTLRPGETATVDITDFSTCNAPLSDIVRVYPPDSKLFVDLPLDLRGCAISVRPAVHG